MIITGLERFLSNSEKYNKRRMALIANQTSVTSDFKYSWDSISESGMRLNRIFSPEHGLFSTEQDQVAVNTEPFINCGNCEITSLYGQSQESLIPDSASLDDIDLVIFDIQDIGTRYYTYANTMALFMKALSGTDIEFMVLDRPNPLGGMLTEGPGLLSDYESFVGVFPVPVRHGLTVAELALMYRDIHELNINLSFIKMEGWQRSMLFHDTGLPWIPPSPNMPTETASYLYPGICLLEGTNLSEGRGTTVPFSCIGAPYIDPAEYALLLNSFDLPGVYFRPVFFKPAFNKFSGETAGGVYIHITDFHVFQAFITGIAIVKAAFDLYGDHFEFLTGVYEFNDIHPAFDLLTGSSVLREMIIAGSSIQKMKAAWADDENRFADIRREYMIYDIDL